MSSPEEDIDSYVPLDPDLNYTPLFSVTNGNLTIGAPVRNERLTTFGHPDLITQFRNPNDNQVVEPVLSAGGYILGTDIILGSLSTTTFLSNTVGTYICNNLSVSGNINNNNLTSALNSKQQLRNFQT